MSLFGDVFGSRLDENTSSPEDAKERRKEHSEHMCQLARIEEALLRIAQAIENK